MHRIMNIGPGKGFFLVALKAKLFFLNIKELGILGVVYCMAGFALPGIDRFVHRGLVGCILKIVMTGQADIRDRLTHLHCRDLAVREVTNFAVFLLNRLVNDTGRETGNQFRVAFGASHAFL